MSEWRELKTLQEVAAAQANGEEIERMLVGFGWEEWNGFSWNRETQYRARPKAETVTVRRALFQNGMVIEGIEAFIKESPGFTCWLGDPVTYTKGGAK